VWFMLNKIKNVVVSILNNTIYDIIKYLLISLIPTAGIGFFLSIVSNIQRFSIVILILAFLITFVIISAIANRNKYDYIFKKRDYEYVYQNNSTIMYIENYTIISYKNNLEMISDKYVWTGKGNIDIKMDNSYAELFFPKKEDYYQKFLIYFKEPLKKYQEMSIKLIWTMENVDPEPFYSLKIHAPTEIINISIKINPIYYIANNVYLHKYKFGKDHSNKNLETRYLNHIDGFLVYTWTIKKPRVGYRCKIIWDIGERIIPL